MLRYSLPALLVLSLSACAGIDAQLVDGIDDEVVIETEATGWRLFSSLPQLAEHETTAQGIAETACRERDLRAYSVPRKERCLTGHTDNDDDESVALCEKARFVYPCVAKRK